MEKLLQDRLRYLFNRYALRQTSIKEEEELFELLNDDQTEAIAKTLLAELMAQEQMADIEEERWKPVLEKILHQQQVALVKKIVPWKWIAAASIILVSAMVLYLARPGNQQPGIVKTPVPVQTDVAPGTQGAILTLADGKTIVLDSTFGNIASEGGVAVINKDGQLVYGVSRLPSDDSRLPSDDSPLPSDVSRLPSHVSPLTYHTMTTPRGRQYQLTLQDGSKVWLNAASSIRFPTAFTGRERVVEVTGEVYFEIAHNAAKPFIVSVNDMQVEVLGTHFNINSYADETAIKTTLIEGKVRVTRNGSIAILKPGEQALSSGNAPLNIDHSPDLDEVLAWKNGFFHFNGASLQQVLRQIVRWYDVDVVYQGTVPDRKFGGEISRNSNLSQVLKILEESKVHFTIEDKKLIVKP